MRPAAETIDTLAQNAHRLAGLDPGRYRRRIVGLALMGSLIVHSVWLVCAAAVLGIVVLSMFLEGPVLILAVPFAAIGAVWLWMLLEQAPDDGIPIDARTAPALVELVAQVADELRAPMPTHLDLNPELNAWVYVRQRPFGQWRMSIGLPVLLAFEVRHFRALVAHELGHFVSGTWGARLVWAQQAGLQVTLRLLGNRGMGRFVRKAFASWGIRFQAEAVAMARQHERSSDAAAAKVAGAAAAAEGLVLLTLAERLIRERFWPEVWRRPSDRPPEDVFLELRHFLKGLGREDLDRYYRSALLDPTLTFDVHPSLADRILGLGQQPRLPATIEGNAAVALLGSQLEPLARALGGWWAASVKTHWVAERERGAELAQVLVRTSNRVPTELHPADALDRAIALRRAGRLTEAIPCYRRAADLNPDVANARLGLGLALLEMGDAHGLSELARAVSLSQRDPDTVVEAYCGARRFLEVRGEPERNPFVQAYHRVRNDEGRSHTVDDWGPPVGMGLRC